MSVLNPEQEVVVLHECGPLRVGAVAGAGKTTALVERVAHLVEKRGVPPERILLISFSRIAKDEMAKRLGKRLPSHKEALEASVRTFHSIALAIYKEEIGHNNIDTSGALWSRATADACRRLGVEPAKDVITKFSSRIKSAMIPVDDVFSLLGAEDPRLVDIAQKCSAESGGHLTADDVIDVFRVAEKIRLEEGVSFQGDKMRFVTFDDMLYECALLLRSNEAIRKKWQSRWSHVLQDEAQDENATQAFIAEALAEGHRNYVVVGDPAQSIYGFRGSSPSHILNFHKEWPDSKTVFMHRNYRSCIEIIELANRILGNMPANSVLVDDDDAPMEMTCERKVHGITRLHSFDTSFDEAISIAHTIQAKYDSNQAQFRDQAVLVRMNYMTCDIEIALARASIPYRLVSGSSFFDTKEAKMITGFARVALGRAGESDLAATLAPFRISKALSKRIASSAAEEEDDLVSTVDRFRVSDMALTEWQRSALMKWSDHAKALARMATTEGATWCVRHISSMVAPAEREEGEDSSSARTVDQYIEMADSFASLAELVSTVDRIEKQKRGRKVNAVTISTIHKAKGAEWKVVYLPQLIAGRFPSWRADMIEERRLFYVAATRAMDELWMSYPVFAIENGKAETRMSPSAFIAETEVKETEYREPGPVDKTPVGGQMGLKL